MKLKEKLRECDKPFLERNFLEKLLQICNLKYSVNDLIKLGHISVIKKGHLYLNNQLPYPKNPYVVGAVYMQEEEFMFWGFDRYNKEGFTTQVSNLFTIYNLKYSKELEIVWLRFQFKKVKPAYFFGKTTKNIDGYRIHYMTRERLFLEYLGEYPTYPIYYFTDIYQTLNPKLLASYAKKYSVKQMLLKLEKIQQCT